MKTLEKDKAEAEEVTARSVKEISRGQIEISKISVTGNHRKHFDAVQMKELAENIKAVGVLQDILVRPDGGDLHNNRYFLIAGERRLRAAKEAGLTKIPARILDVDDAQAEEIQAFENLHRENLNPIEEARSFKMLMDKHGHKAERLADRVSKSVAYVYRMIRLLDLPDQVIKAIEEEQITAAHGTVIARLQDHAEQVSLLQSIVAKKLSAKAAENALAGHARDITKAPFDVAGCGSCKHNGKKQKDLFDNDTELAGRCMNPACFDTKVLEAKGAPQKTRKAKKAKAGTSSGGSQGGLYASIEAIVGQVRADVNLGYMRPLADGILLNAADPVKYAFMKRRDPHVIKGDVDKDIRKYLAKLTDFFVPGFCVEMTILSENSVKEGELVHQFKKLYGIGKTGASAAGPADKSVLDSLKALGAQMGKDEKAAKSGAKKK